jgi:hypothetical protein
MCHCKACAGRLHVIIVIIAIAIPYSLASCLIRFPFLHTCLLFTSPRFLNVLPIVHDTSSKNAKLSSATTLFCDVALTPARITDITLSRVTRAGSHFVLRIRHSLPTKKVTKVEKVKYFRNLHTLRSLSDQQGDVCKVWFRLVQKCEFV